MTKTILVTGADGLVGNAVKSLEKQYPNFSLVFANRRVCNLLEPSEIRSFLQVFNPNYIIHTAARVGGIGRNLNSPVQQFNDNILMNTNLIKEAHEHGVEKFIGFGSVCAFPSNAEVLTENNYLSGEPFPAHKTYAYSKRMMTVQLEAYKEQYGMNVCSILPGNIFGENDNFNLEDGHVVPSLIHKCHLAKTKNEYLKVWGNGTAKREFLYANDVAKICLELLEKTTLPQRLIVSGEQEYQIKDIVFKITDLFQHNKIEWELDKPNGQNGRKTSKQLFRSLFPDFTFTDIDLSLKNTIDWFIKNYEFIRK